MLRYDSRNVGDVEILTLSGCFDASGAAAFRAHVVQRIEQGKRKFVFVFSGVDFIDSTGLGFLVSILKTTLKHGGRLRIACLVPMIYEIFVMTKLDQVFAIDETEEQSLEAIQTTTI
ncbi:anti-anti-sigma factor superfamily, putative [Heliomicrobium modesticaldum Ice1]|uniref:Anti-sigma factor antagonist n=1 Tax=Heliobacterium modesticaldum (strain ATCC 51547 / Ice1) TaxID=498761 RepID=B0TFG0_HELMI|nr:STAS domain-containing protein [Heliomicrobium modesticaldum]ABZ83059.1 anti-anti-sigma factor superfamily, putative [Heliomicrobium modesticaldum Ice1]